MLQIKGNFNFKIYRKGQLICNRNTSNIWTLSGLALCQNVFINGIFSPPTNWYIGLIDNNAFDFVFWGDTATGHSSRWHELPVTDPRPEWIPDDTEIANFKVGNFNTPAQWTVPAANDGDRFIGAFIVADDDEPYPEPATQDLGCAACAGKEPPLFLSALDSSELIQEDDTIEVEYSVTVPPVA